MTETFWRNQAVDQDDKELELYLYESNGYYKIGYSSNIKKRVRNFHTSNPSGVLYWSSGMMPSRLIKDLETHFHDRFRKQRKRGEWFHLYAHDVMYIIAFIEIIQWTFMGLRENFTLNFGVEPKLYPETYFSTEKTGADVEKYIEHNVWVLGLWENIEVEE